MINTKHLQVPYQHEKGKELTQFDNAYEKGAAWCPSGIRALRHAGINPYHASIYERDDTSPVVVYFLNDHTTGTERFWFENEYQAAFEAFRDAITDGNPDEVQLFAAVLKPCGDAKTTFERNDPFEHHGSVCHWSDSYQSWQF